jgi:hypothetical protein
MLQNIKWNGIKLLIEGSPSDMEDQNPQKLLSTKKTIKDQQRKTVLVLSCSIRVLKSISHRKLGYSSNTHDKILNC